MQVYILSAARTAVGSMLGSLSTIPAPTLGSIAIKEAWRRSGVSGELVDEVIMGCVLQAGLGQGVARQAAMEAGLSERTPAWSISQVCGSGLKSVAVGANQIALGESHCIIAGGMENMSAAPHVATFVRTPTRWGR